MKCPKGGCDREGDRDTIRGHIFASADHNNDLADDVDDPSEGGIEGSDEDASQNTLPEGGPLSEGQQADVTTPNDTPVEGGIEGSDNSDMPTDDEYKKARRTDDVDQGDQDDPDPAVPTPTLPADMWTVGTVVILGIMIFLAVRFVRTSSSSADSTGDEANVELDLDNESDDSDIDLIE